MKEEQVTCFINETQEGTKKKKFEKPQTVRVVFDEFP